MDNFTRQHINALARRSGVSLEETHWQVLAFAYAHYQRHRVGPLYRTIRQATGIDRARLETLFPNGLNSLYTWVGIPIASTAQGCKPLIELQVEDEREVYLDHNATTYLRPEVQRQLADFILDPLSYGNPSSSYRLAVSAYEVMEQSRREIATRLDVTPEEIVFTSGGSEANNLAIKGLALRYLGHGGHLVASAIEHPSVLQTLAYLEGLGFEVSYVPPTPQGWIAPEAIGAALREDTILVSVMYANNEIGVINPIEEIGALCRHWGVPLMSDAVQGFGKVQLRPRAWGVGLLSLSGHKIYAPKGVGALFIDRDLQIDPLIHGGSQELGRRAGTENTAAIQALGLASRLAHAEMEDEQRRLRGLRDHFLRALDHAHIEYRVNGDLQRRLPANLNLGFPGIDSGALLLSLNQIGVYASAGSACSAGSDEASHVLRAIGADTRNLGMIRFSMGLATREADIDYVVKHLGPILAQLRREPPSIHSDEQGPTEARTIRS